MKSNDLVALILQILDSEKCAHYQDTYLGILVRYVLPRSMNHSDIAAEQWKELLVICEKLYKRARLKKHIVLDALQLIVEYSFSHVNLLANIKNSLLFLGIIFSSRSSSLHYFTLFEGNRRISSFVFNLSENIVEDITTNNEQLIESFYKLANSVCRHIATESRITLCKFSETILMGVLHLHSSEEKYRLLLMFLQIHHPEGVSKCDDGAYAYDWSKWKDSLRSMYLLVQENCKLDVKWRGFVQFASEGMYGSAARSVFSSIAPLLSTM